MECKYLALKIYSQERDCEREHPQRSVISEEFGREILCPLE
jgi:hypothetical protein